MHSVTLLGPQIREPNLGEMLRKIAPVRELAPEELFGYGPFPKSEPASQ